MTKEDPKSVQRRMPKEERSEQLLNVAEELVKTKGFDDTSIEDVAKAAGVTRPIVYQHFGTKEGLFLACIERARCEVRSELEPIFKTAETPEAGLREAAEVWFGLVERDPARWKIFFSTALPLTGTLAERIAERTRVNDPLYAASLASWAPEGTPKELISAVTAMFIGASDQLARWWLDHPEVPKQLVVDSFVEFCMAGVEQWR